MPICGYVLFPVKNRFDEMVRSLHTNPECTVYPSDDRVTAVLVTDTTDDDSEEKLRSRIERIESIQCMSMTFVHIDTPRNKEAVRA